MQQRILCVDDEPILTELMGILVDERLSDCQLMVARGAVEAHSLIREKFSLFLIDVMMPGIDGFALCREIRSLHADTPILMFSAKSGEVETQALAAGANYFIRKPFDVDEFMNLIHHLLLPDSQPTPAV